MKGETPKETRSRVMASVKGRNTTPEILIRKALFSKGFRYKIHVSTLPGRPDIVLTRWKVVILVDGCFWHSHGCSRSRIPRNNADYWEKKLARNLARDQANIQALIDLGWRVCRVWTCALQSQRTDEVARLADEIALWIVQGGLFKSFGDAPTQHSAL